MRVPSRRFFVRWFSPPNPTYIVDLVKKVTTVAVETMNIVDFLP
ncbi:helicase [Mycobacteroides abscessus subsp. massiliense]|nr:hypothetical protein [Mycobacteroides abscessus]SKY24162.1 helicase [Mycobacteroides abscessus subsp. massiliense]SKY65840.1 helicase [Mycobacteroides abscessus subsp. massiliense]